MNALFVDTFRRDLQVFMVSVTEVPGKGLVLRFGTKVANLWQLTKDRRAARLWEFDVPIILSTRGYAARSSEGFVKVLKSWSGANSRIKTQIIGIQGFPWMRGTKSLRRVKSPMDVRVLRPRTNIEEIETHSKGFGPKAHSNPKTAHAALVGIEMMSRIRPHSVFVVEGQSDYTRAWEFTFGVGYFDEPEPFEIEWPTEHNTNVFPEAEEGYQFGLWKAEALKNPMRQYRVDHEGWGGELVRYREVTQEDRLSRNHPHDYEDGALVDSTGFVQAWVSSHGYLRRPGIYIEHMGPWFYDLKVISS